MKLFTIDVSLYPMTYEVKAETKEAAILAAQELFYLDTGKSVWTAEVTGEEEIA